MNDHGKFSDRTMDAFYDEHWPAVQYRTTSNPSPLAESEHATTQGLEHNSARVGAFSINYLTERAEFGIINNHKNLVTPVSGAFSSPSLTDSRTEASTASSLILDGDDYQYHNYRLSIESFSPTSPGQRSNIQGNLAHLRSLDRSVSFDKAEPRHNHSPSILQTESGYVTPWSLDHSFVYPSPWSPQTPAWPVQTVHALPTPGQLSLPNDAHSRGLSDVSSNTMTNRYDAREQLDQSGSSASGTSNVFTASGEHLLAQPRKTQPRPNKTRETTVQSRRHPERRTCHICERAGVKSKISFKGQHEFARHNNKRHSEDKKQWICLDPTPDKRHAWCKKCREGKLYAVNYNAAEHLRRAHLHPDGSERANKKVKGAPRRDAVDRAGDNHDRAQGHPRIQDMIRLGWLSSVYSSDNFSDASPDTHKQSPEGAPAEQQPREQWYNEQQQQQSQMFKLDPVFMMTGGQEYCLDEAQFDTPISDTSSILDAMSNSQQIPQWGAPLGYHPLAYNYEPGMPAPRAVPYDVWGSGSLPLSDLDSDVPGHMSQASSMTME